MADSRDDNEGEFYGCDPEYGLTPADYMIESMDAWEPCPICGEPHEPYGILDTDGMTRMSEDESLPRAVRNVLEASAVAIVNASKTIKDATETADDMRRMMGLFLYVHGGAIMVPQNIIVASPNDFHVTRHEPYDKPGPVWKLTMSEWAGVPKP